MILALALVLSAGCAAADGGPAPGASQAGAAGELTFAVTQDAASFDPASTYTLGAADGSRLTAVYDLLVWSDPATGTVRPQIADSFAPGDGGRTWTLRLRPGVRFTDGTPFDAEAVRFNWERHRDPSNRSLQLAATSDITALEVVDPLTLVVRLARPNANFDRIVAGQLGYIGSPTAIRADPVGVGRAPVGAGPFVLTEWTPGQRQVFVRNTDYWQKDRGLPRFDRVTMVVDHDPTHIVEEISRGRVDATMTFDPTPVADAKDRKLGVAEMPLHGGAMLAFNTAAAPFDDVRVRRAVALALDVADIDTRFYQGKGSPAQGVFTSTSSVANIQLAMPQNDPEQARNLFAQVTRDGTRTLAFVLLVPEAPTVVKVAEHIRDTLNRYPGVAAQIQVTDVPTFIQTVRKDAWTWSAALTQLWLADPEPGLYDFLLSTSSANITGYKNPVVDKALNDSRVATDTTMRRVAYTAVQMKLNEDVPFWVYQESLAAAVHGDRVSEVQIANDGVLLWDRLNRR
ncbi:ABC transporter substrate-binding protein [Yinghuangia sp. YIM S09857]|uniref:ABC transporter substrate-binding protein n=1 Tax=Yinghuangia sp. YIM S09857 TaxID=3436929 RepID=UPI003F53A1D6